MPARLLAPYVMLSSAARYPTLIRIKGLEGGCVEWSSKMANKRADGPLLEDDYHAGPKNLPLQAGAMPLRWLEGSCEILLVACQGAAGTDKLGRPVWRQSCAALCSSFQ